MLAWRQVLSALWLISGSIKLVMPITDVNDIDNGRTFFVGKNCILNIFCRCQSNELSFPVFLFPLVNHICPELYKIQRARILCCYQLNDATVIPEIIQALPDE